MGILALKRVPLQLMAAVVALLVLVACGGTPAPPGPVTYSVSGVVTSFGGAPEEGITVVLGGESVTTDASGKWQFTGLTGSHSVGADQQPGLVTCPFAITVSGETSGLVFTAHNGNTGPGDMAGAGTTTDPFVVTDVDQLQALDGDLMAHYVLCDHVDASAKSDFTPIAAGSPIPFEGTLDGQEYEIRGLHLNYPTEQLVGLFAKIGPSGTVRNLGLEGGSTAGEALVGAVAGENQGTIESVFNTGSVSATDSQYDDGVGGLVGANTGSISNALNTGAVTGQDDVGGIAGTNYGPLNDSYNSGDITGATYVGGLAGYSEIDIADSFNIGAIVGNGQVGGLVGGSTGIIIADSYNNGSVTGDFAVGGLVGELIDTEISDSSNDGAVVGVSVVGGLAGTLENTHITASHNAGAVTGEYAVGGIAGEVHSNSSLASTRNTGEILGLGETIGGIAGENNGVITTSMNAGAVTHDGTGNPTNCCVGGITGWNASGAEIHASYNLAAVTSQTGAGVGGIAGGNNGQITTSYNWGAVSGVTEVGGIAGVNDFEIIHTYSIGEVTANSLDGGIAGVAAVASDIQSSYFDGAKAKDNYPAEGQNKTDAALKLRSTFFGWNFGTVWVDADGDYPDLIDNPR